MGDPGSCSVSVVGWVQVYYWEISQTIEPKVDYSRLLVVYINIKIGKKDYNVRLAGEQLNGK